MDIMQKARKVAALIERIEEHEEEIGIATAELTKLFGLDEDNPPFKVGDRVHNNSGTRFAISQVEKRRDGSWWIRSSGSMNWYPSTGFTLG